MSRALNYLPSCFFGMLLVACSAGAELKRGPVIVDPDNPSWLKYRKGGSFFLAGPGDPEGFLYRGRLKKNGTRKGDQVELIRKLAKSGANSIYLMAVRSHGGDGDWTENPFKDHRKEKGINKKVLKQWNRWFRRMDRKGITIFFIFYDDSADPWQTGDSVGSEERAFLRTLVNAFSHHNHLIWVVAEEYQERLTPTRVSRIAAQIRSADSSEHPIAVHKLNGLRFEEFADDPNIDQFAIQYHAFSPDDQHEGMLMAFKEAAGRYNLNMAEAPSWGSGAVARKKAWAVAMGGAYVMAYQMDIESTPPSDLRDLGLLKDFMEATDFATMEPRDDLARGATLYVLANPGSSYIAYADQGNGALGIADLRQGEYELFWIDTATGASQTQRKSLSAGTHSFERPSKIGAEAALYLRRLG